MPKLEELTQKWETDIRVVMARATYIADVKLCRFKADSEKQAMEFERIAWRKCSKVLIDVMNELGIPFEEKDVCRNRAPLEGNIFCALKKCHQGEHISDGGSYGWF